MPGTVVVDAGWGDGGKGKVVDLLSPFMHMGVRYQGGPNAGHTISNRIVKKFVLRMIPAVIFNPEAIAVMGRRMIIDIDTLIDEEIQELRSRGITLEGRLKISPHASIRMPWHVYEDLRNESQSNRIGTTGKGIGPCQQSKFGRRNAILMHELRDMTKLLDRLWPLYKERKRAFLQLYCDSLALPDFAKIKESLERGREHLLPYIENTILIVQKALREGKNVCFELAQGTMLDIEDGTYPYVTPSYTTVSDLCKAMQIPISEIKKILLVVKAYPTRVGLGPFPTKLPPEENARLRKLGNEYGSVTGRERDCGLPDFMVIKYACYVNGFLERPIEIALTKLDVLFKLERIPVCTSYNYLGRILAYGSDIGETELLEFDRMEPIYTEEYRGRSGIENAKSINDLPDQAKMFIRSLEFHTGKPVTVISTGPAREDTIIV